MKSNQIILGLVIASLLGGCATMEPVGPKPVTPHPTPESRAELDYLYVISGNYTMTGQHNFPNTKDTYTQQSTKVWGKSPAIYGEDFGFAKPGDKDAAAARPDMIAEVERQFDRGSLVTLCWHAVRPTDNEPVTFRGSVQAKLTDAQWEELITPGTPLYGRWCAQVDVIAGYLKKLQDAHVPVLWRPYHEMNGDWFWWGGRPGPRGTIALYHQLYDRLVNYHKLRNLIWIWSLDRPSTPQRQFKDYFPGREYFDIASLDVYRGDFQQSYYDQLLVVADGKPITLAEVGPAPKLAVLESQPKWTWWMTWAGMAGRGPVTNDMHTLVNSPRSLSLSDVEFIKLTAPIRKASERAPLPPPPNNP